MSKKFSAMSDSIQNQVTIRVNAFNERYMAKKDCKYIPIIKGKFIYLMRTTFEQKLEPVCRLTYQGDLEDMSFAIFKWSSETYSSSEMFPGDNHIDGTLEGAMKAGLKAYPA